MTRSDGDDEAARELREALIGAGLAQGVNLLVRAGDGVVQVHLMAVDLGRLASDLPAILARLS
jgi:hypothetical protein